MSAGVMPDPPLWMNPRPFRWKDDPATVGIGQFGRDYEAINRYNRSMPGRVALKVHRIEKGKQKEATQHADVTMEIARDLSSGPHVIRIYDANSFSEDINRLRRLKHSIFLDEIVVDWRSLEWYGGPPGVDGRRRIIQ